MTAWTRWDTSYRKQPPLALFAAAALALVFLGFLLHSLTTTAAVPAAMGVFHIVAFRVANKAHLPALTEGMLALKDECVLDGKAYIRSVAGGKQSSKEGHERGMQVVFLLEFENQAHTDYYVFKDPAHNAFKDKIADWGVEDVTVLDFVPGAF